MLTNDSSLFSSSNNSNADMSNPGNQIDKKLQQRQELFSSETNFNQICER